MSVSQNEGQMGNFKKQNFLLYKCLFSSESDLNFVMSNELVRKTSIIHRKWCRLYDSFPIGILKWAPPLPIDKSATDCDDDRLNRCYSKSRISFLTTTQSSQIGYLTICSVKWAFNLSLMRRFWFWTMNLHMNYMCRCAIDCDNYKQSQAIGTPVYASLNRTSFSFHFERAFSALKKFIDNKFSFEFQCSTSSTRWRSPKWTTSESKCETSPGSRKSPRR